MSSPIPIQNIYYLLCYSWHRSLDSTELVDLFATVLLTGTHHLLRRGLDQGYHVEEGELAGVRGRVNVGITARRMLLYHGRAYCQYDELTVDTLPNQILRSTARHLVGVPGLNKDLRSKLMALDRELGGISDIRLTRSAFRKVQLHTNNSFYRFLLDICELVLASSILDETTGEYKFRDFVRDEGKMWKLFQEFVFNFYRIHCPNLDIRAERIDWSATSSDDPSLAFLPAMYTDISVRSSSRTLIIDTKFYTETLQRSQFRQSIHSSHLYQLFSYLKNLEARGGSDSEAEGMLLYPVVEKPLRLSYSFPGHRVRVCTVDLSARRPEIHDQLLELLSESMSVEGLAVQV